MLQDPLIAPVGCFKDEAVITNRITGIAVGETDRFQTISKSRILCCPILGNCSIDDKHDKKKEADFFHDNWFYRWLLKPAVRISAMFPGSTKQDEVPVRV